MDKIRLLLVEDDASYTFVLKGSLELTGKYVVHTACDATEGYKLYKEIKPDIIVSDIEMPGMSGLEMVERIRKEDDKTPILFASGRNTPQDLIEGLHYGGNSYIRKPYLPEELDAHITGLLKLIDIKTEKEDDMYTPLSIGSYLFNFPLHHLEFKGDKFSLTARESEILMMLYKHKNKIVKREDILQSFWNNTDFYASRSLDVFVSKLRKFLEQDQLVKIQTIRGRGLRLVC